MPLEIPNYDSVVGRAASPSTDLEDAEVPDLFEAMPRTAREPVVEAAEWDPNRVELDLDELEGCLSRA